MFFAVPILFSLLYVAAFEIGMLLYFEPANVSALWPACGVSLAFLLKAQPKQRPVLFLLLFVLHLACSWPLGSWSYATGMAAAALVEVACAYSLCRQGNCDVCTSAGLLRLFTACAVASVCGAVIGAASIILFVPGVTGFFQVFQTWCLADLTGMMLVTPALLAWSSPKRTRGVAGRTESVVLLGLIVFLTWHLFVQPSPAAVTVLDMPYLIVPALIWAALRTDPAVVASIATMIGFSIVISTDLGMGLFFVPAASPNSMALAAQVFVATILLSPLVLATVISDRQAEARSRQQSEQGLKITLNSIAEAVVSVDEEGRILRMNPVAERLTGWFHEEATGQSAEKVLSFLDSRTGDAVSIPSGLTVTRGDVEHVLLRSRGDEEYTVAVSAAPILSSAGEKKGTVVVFRDITAEQALQERLRHSEKMQAIGQLAGGVAHDFNNMLGGIIGAAELLQQNQGDASTRNRYLDLIFDTAERASALTDKLLAFARRQPTANTVIDIHQPLLDALALLRTGLDQRIQIHENFWQKELLALGDVSQLQNAFLNLFLNATQAMPEGGTIYLTSRPVDLEPQYCAASPFEIEPGPYMEVEIRDSGHGISPEDMPNIFDPFYTTKDVGMGTGLGLSAVLGTIQQHSGAITVYSEPGAGTSFHVLLPIAGTAPSGEVETAPSVIQGSETILLVDDEAIMRDTASALLEDMGYTVLVAEDGQKGLELFEQAKDRIDLVILDMLMPGLNGRECFTAMQRICPDVRVVLASGFSQESELETMRAAGLKAYIRKPFRSATLSQTIRDALQDEPSP